MAVIGYQNFHHQKLEIAKLNEKAEKQHFYKTFQHYKILDYTEELSKIR